MNDDLRQQQLALPPVSELSERLAQIPDVLGVGIGFRFVGRHRTEELAFTVDVREKLPLSRVPSSRRIPHEFAGVPIDVRGVRAWVDAITVDPSSDEFDIEFEPMPGGASISYKGSDFQGTSARRGHATTAAPSNTEHQTALLHDRRYRPRTDPQIDPTTR